MPGMKKSKTPVKYQVGGAVRPLGGSGPLYSRGTPAPPTQQMSQTARMAMAQGRMPQAPQAQAAGLANLNALNMQMQQRAQQAAPPTRAQLQQSQALAKTQLQPMSQVTQPPPTQQMPRSPGALGGRAVPPTGAQPMQPQADAMRAQMQQGQGGQRAPAMDQRSAMAANQALAGAQQGGGTQFSALFGGGGLPRPQATANAAPSADITALAAQAQATMNQQAAQGGPAAPGLAFKRGGVVGKPKVKAKAARPMPAFKKGGVVKKAKGGMIGKGCK